MPWLENLQERGTILHLNYHPQQDLEIELPQNKAMNTTMILWLKNQVIESAWEVPGNKSE